MKENLNDKLLLYLVTDSNGISDTDFYRIVEDAVSAGAGVVQLREKNMSSLDMYNRAVKLKKICANAGAIFIVNDRIDIAQAADADGVHLGKNDLPTAQARKILGNDKIIGATAKSVAAAQEAYLAGADYFGIGAFFKTSTKTDAVTMTADEVRTVTKSTNAPFVGIGGLKYDNLCVLKGTGVKGAAVSSAVMRADNVKETVKKMREKLLSVLD